MSFKPLFSKSLAADPDRLHVAAHSHHLWPDASYDGQIECWEDAARLADRKWDRIMGEVWPEAQRHVGNELGGVPADRLVFSANTHDLIIRLVAACPRKGEGPLRILTTDGEFHSARRQFARWVEEGRIALDVVAAEPFETLGERVLDAARTGEHDLIFVSQMLFGAGRALAPLEPIVDLADPEGPWVVVDGYHSFMAIPEPFAKTLSDKAFFLGGGYKYAMAGEGMGFMACPPGFGPRPPLTGWYAEFDDLTLPPGMVGYAPDAMRFMGATFDASSLYRFNHIRRMLADQDLDTASISAHVQAIQQRFVGAIEGTVLGQAKLLNSPGDNPGARFLAFRHDCAADWCTTLKARNVITDVRGRVIRFGFGLYHDPDDVDALVAHLKELS
ncbi:class V aminotransferase [Sphingomicrobium clamense]|uniref:Class V aminotransferase n=1 Tax=Sphingomicrobium clamense TaxID=2851013 RepID=A0ABS6V326_9SPHN|nr:class V aminotransferase [Sphingomicrobium sp. B8]MBW0143876.1 class V aminotransferase [Sphingomicrobium sp. B8]